MNDLWLTGDTRERLRELDAGSVHTCVTSPPYYGLRDYGCDGQIGLERTPDEYVAALVAVFREVRRVLRDDGTLWLNLGDSYAANRPYQVHNTRGAKGHTHSAGSKVPKGLKPKDLIGIPWRVAFALQDDGWYLRSDIIWHKPNPMPESVADRPTKAHEYMFLLSKSERYYYNADAIREPDSKSPAGGGKGRNKRTVWTIAPQPFDGAHFATMPPALAEPCVLAGSPVGGVVLDPFGGAGTTALVARRTGRRFVHIDLSYHEIARRRVDGEGYQPPLFTVGGVAA